MTRMDAGRALEVLELDAKATPQDIKNAYRDLAKVWHPDRFQGDSRVQQKAIKRLKEINEAYEILRDYARASRTHSRPHRASAGSGAAQDQREAQESKQGAGSGGDSARDPGRQAPEVVWRTPHRFEVKNRWLRERIVVLRL